MTDDIAVRGLIARPTTYAGTSMRSRLEARYAAWLDNVGINWTYEPRCFASPEGQYLPDFRLDGVEWLGSPRRVYVELKPTPAAITREVRAKAAIVFANEPDAFMLFESPGCLAELHCPPSLGGTRLTVTWARTAPAWAPSLVAPIDLSWWRHAS